MEVVDILKACRNGKRVACGVSADFIGEDGVPLISPEHPGVANYLRFRTDIGTYEIDGRYDPAHVNAWRESGNGKIKVEFMGTITSEEMQKLYPSSIN